MGILGNDGKPYKTAGTASQFAPQSSQLKLFDLWDEAAIKIGGTPVYYYEMFISPGEIDTDYFESRGKLWSDHPVELYAVYDPQASQNHMNQFGVDSLNEIILECNAQAVLRAVGHMPKVGSRIHTPHLGDDWEIIQTNLGEFKLWGAMRLLIICKQWQGNVTDESALAVQKKPNIPKPI